MTQRKQPRPAERARRAVQAEAAKSEEPARIGGVRFFADGRVEVDGAVEGAVVLLGGGGFAVGGLSPFAVPTVLRRIAQVAEERAIAGEAG